MTRQTFSSPATLYSHCPWIIIPDSDAFEELFAESPVLELAAHENHDFGRRQRVWHIDEGIIATYNERPDGCRMTALFAKGTHLGAPKALLHPASTMRLSCRTLTPARVRPVDAVRYRRFLAEHPQIELQCWKTLARSHSAIIDGMMVNGLEPVPVRLMHLFSALTSLDRNFRRDADTLLPIEATAEELAMLTHATRAVISRQLSAWTHAGIIRRDGRKIVLLPSFWEH